MNISASSLSLQIVTFRAQSVSALFDSSSSDDFGSLFQAAANSSPADALTGTSGGASALSATGRNTSLYDPESAFNMMTVINQKDVDYKAQYSELNSMKTEVDAMASAASGLSGISTSTGDADIRTQLQGFVDKYNAWVKRFDGDMQQGGVLAGTQAAQVARHELDANMDNWFYGAADGVRGLRDLGIETDPVTGLASLDTAKLDAALSGNRQGVIDALQEFSAGFAKSAEMLNSTGNFIPNQLNNLGSAISYIDNNIASWRQEFGTGSAAKPNTQTSQALAAYNAANSIA
jgi:flagellar capping protein FliD